LESLSDKVRQTAFADARNSANDTALLGPPILDFAPYGRTPGGKRRSDARQGLIDQDPEFIEFLESLTSPVAKAAAPDNKTPRSKDGPVTVTPLIQHLRDKKAAKEKAFPVKITKNGKDTPKPEAPRAKAEEKTTVSFTKAASVTIEKKGGRGTKIEKSGKDGGKLLKKEQQTPAAPPPTILKPAAEHLKVNATGKERQPVTVPGAAAARMLQRDLGLQSRGRAFIMRGGRGAVEIKKASSEPNNGVPVPKPFETTVNKQQLGATPAENLNENAKPGPPTASRAASSKRPPVGTPHPKPATKAAVLPTNTGTQVRPPAPQRVQAPAVSLSTTTEAFLKHANPSQGVTEPLIEEAMKGFGLIRKVEIDKRKGFAYVEFAEPEGLRNAIAASPVKVAQSQVQILERKDRGSSRAPQTPAAQVENHPLQPANPRVGVATNSTTQPSFRSGRGGRSRVGGGGVIRVASSVSPDLANTANVTTVQASNGTSGT